MLTLVPIFSPRLPQRSPIIIWFVARKDGVLLSLLFILESHFTPLPDFMAHMGSANLFIFLLSFFPTEAPKYFLEKKWTNVNEPWFSIDVS